MWDPYAEFQTATLPNGLAVHAAHWPDRPWEAMGFLIHSGAEQDPVGLEGLTHFVEHLVSENLSVSKNDMRKIFKDWGGAVRLGTTGYHFTHYRLFVPAEKDKLERALSMFGEMLLLAGLRKFIERERRVIIGEFHLSYPVKFAYDLEIQKQKAVYKDTWLERFVSPLGNPESIESMTQTDLQMQYDMHYTPANMSVVGVGGIELDQLVSLLANSPFGINKQGTRTPLPTPMSVVEPLTENRYIFEFSHHVSMATPLRVGQYLSIAKLPGTIKPGLVELVEAMLDEKLMEEVRERRAWTYHIETDSYDFRYLWEFSIRCRGLEPKALDKIENVVEIALASMNEDLFEQAKHRALASSRMIDPTGNKICKGALNDLANNYRIISLAEYDTEIERITMSDIREVLKLLRPAQRYTVITKP